MSDAEWVGLNDLAGFLPAPTPDDDKYSRGVVGLAVGSEDYPGAAVLAGEAAVCAGAGLVRVIAPSRVCDIVLARRPEVVCVGGRVDSLVVGSGMVNGATADVASRVASCDLADDGVVIVDAGALAETPELPGHKILTPHAGEMGRLAQLLGLPGQTAGDWAEAVAAAWGVIVVLKGNRPRVYSPDGLAHQLPAGTPWLASAGTGDVLAGLMGAMAALTHASPRDVTSLAQLAAAAVLVHQEAARRGSTRSGEGRMGPIRALELAGEVSAVVSSLVAGQT